MIYDFSFFLGSHILGYNQAAMRGCRQIGCPLPSFHPLVNHHFPKQMPFGSIWGYTTYFQTHPNGDMVGTLPIICRKNRTVSYDQTIGDSIQKKNIGGSVTNLFLLFLDINGPGICKKGGSNPHENGLTSTSARARPLYNGHQSARRFGLRIGTPNSQYVSHQPSA